MKIISNLYTLDSSCVYHSTGMAAISKDRELTTGFVGHVLMEEDQFIFIDPSDDYNLSRHLAYAEVTIVGRGVLVEKVESTADFWIVAWRPFEKKPRLKKPLTS